MQGHSEISPSPDGAYAVHAEPWEALASQWLYRPRILDAASGVPLWSPSDGMWSLDGATWESDSVVRLLLRKFPGNQSPSFIGVTVYCEAMVAIIDGLPECGLADLERQLDAVLVSRAMA